MKNANSKRLLTLVLALVLVFALSVGALAAWPSFQNDETNNGVIPDAPPTTSPVPSSVTAVHLDTNGYPYSGIDATPVINDGKAYVVYNGGAPGTGDIGGARLACVDITSTNPNTATIWDIQLDADANNAQQLGTPYYCEDAVNGDKIYAGVTYYTDCLASTPMSDWNNGAIGNTLTIPAHDSVQLSLNSVLLNGAYSDAYFNTKIVASSGVSLHASATMYAWYHQTLYSYDTSYSWADSEFCIYNQHETLLPSDTYTVNITIYNDSDFAVSTTHIALMTSQWRLYEVDDVDTSSPADPVVLTYGQGQFNTPITAYDDYLFFGIYEGDRCYYQLNTSLSSSHPKYLLHYSTYSGAGYYLAGAAIANDGADDFVYFGSEEKYVYKRPIGNSFDSDNDGESIYLYLPTADPGPVRSSICYDGSDLYLTTKNGYLWKLDTDLDDATELDLKDNTYIQNSTSTPVVSEKGYIYVGGYNIIYASNPLNSIFSGAIKAIPISDFDSNHLITVWSRNNQDGAVQSSVIVYSDPDGDNDYLYFTTNCPNGCGYCAYFDTNTQGHSTVWSTITETTNYNTLQGMAADDGYLVFGNDTNYLYLVH